MYADFFDEYVFGYCLHTRNNLRSDGTDEAALLSYMATMLGGGNYPTLAALVGRDGLEPLWRRIDAQMRDPARFERNLQRLLDGFEASVAPA